MKNWIRSIVAIAAVAIASATWAESPAYSIGYPASDGGEINVLADVAANVTVFCDGVPVVVFDNAGVTSVAAGVSYSFSGDFGAFNLVLSGLPPGNYTVVVNIVGDGSSYSPHYSGGWVDAISWNHPYGSSFYSSFIGFGSP